ncbi:MAG TPA: hypothetical protein QF698_09150, partial [Candidatus Marinimicrobia bacterium]|nr:hypothetical protein [Candidatus Neomarinimicrobiota bacterium]
FSIESDGNSGSIIKTGGLGDDAPTISYVRNDDGSFMVTFTGKLQSAPTVNGPWTDVDAPSPVTLQADQPALFGRAVSE